LENKLIPFDFDHFVYGLTISCSCGFALDIKLLNIESVFFI